MPLKKAHEPFIPSEEKIIYDIPELEVIPVGEKKEPVNEIPTNKMPRFEDAEEIPKTEKVPTQPPDMPKLEEPSRV